MSQNDSNINTKDFLIGALIGGAVGAISALMFSPKSGKEIRETIGRESIQLRQKSTELAGMAKERTTQFAKNVTDQSGEAANKVKDLTDKAKNKSLEIVGKKNSEDQETEEVGLDTKQNSYYDGTYSEEDDEK